MKQTVDNIVAPLLSARKGIGLAVGVIDRGQRHLLGYGTLSKACTEPVEGHTVFEIGSVTKVFTAALLALTVEDGLMHFDDPLCDLLPELANLPRDITPIRLATHTSGLPRLPFQFFMRSWLKNPGNPYAAYTIADLVAYLATYRSQHWRKSTRLGVFRYSNFGFGLLGHVLAQRLGMTYEEGIANQLCDTLGMLDTRVTLTSEQQTRCAMPHTSRGKPTSHWDMLALAGAGALRSTVSDMLKFVAANLSKAPTRLERAMRACHEMYGELAPPPQGIRGVISGWLKSRLGNIEPPFGVALGWHLSRLGTSADTVYWHNGATGGYRAFTGFVKESNTGVVILSNRGLGMYDLLFRAPTVEEIGFSLLKCLRQVPDKTRCSDT